VGNTNWLQLLKNYLGYQGATSLADKLTAARAGYLDNINNAQLLVVPNLSTLSAARIGYLDNINQAGLLQVTAARAGYLDNIGNAQLLNIPNLSTLTAARIGYLDNINNAQLINITAARLGYIDRLTLLAAGGAGELTVARVGYLDNINQVGLLQVTAARAALLDQITAARGLLIDRLSLIAAGGAGELTAARAGYLNNINNANLSTVPNISTLSAARIGYLDNLSAGAVALAASWTAALATALGNYTAARAGYLDNINQAGLLQVTAARAALLDQITALRLAELDAGNIPTDLANIIAYVDLIDDAVNGLAAIKAEVEGLAGAAMRGTDGAALAASWTAALATALGNYTAAKAAFLDVAISSRAAAATALSNATWTDAKAGYLTAAVALASVCTAARLGELDAGNVPADVDTLKAAIGAIEGATTLHNKLTAARAAFLDAAISSRAPGATALTNATWTNALATALAAYTAARGGYLDELAAANLPLTTDNILLDSQIRVIQSGVQAILAAATEWLHIDSGTNGAEILSITISGLIGHDWTLATYVPAADAVAAPAAADRRDVIIYAAADTEGGLLKPFGIPFNAYLQFTNDGANDQIDQVTITYRSRGVLTLTWGP